MKTIISKIFFIFTAILVLAAIDLVERGQAHAATGNMPGRTTPAENTVYNIVDTGQSVCNNNSGAIITCPTTGQAAYGQDAQYSGNQPSYTKNGDGTVSDNITGLVWQQSPDTNGDGKIDASDKKAYTQALAYCQDLSLAGYSDWQLPNIKQLYSLIDFRGTDPSGMIGSDTSGLTPFIDTAYFGFAYGDTTADERIIDAQYASSTLYASTSTGQKMFGVNFADGRIKGYGLKLFGADKTFFVLCVRGTTGYGVNNFTDNGDGTVTDQATSLMWSQTDSGRAMNWEAALAWIQEKNAANYLGHNDWRLPDAKELQSIVDYTRSPNTTNSAAIDPIFQATSFTNEGGQTDWTWYWASTSHAASNGTGASAVYLAFGRAGGWQIATPGATCYPLFDVHGAGAQRSDPKTSSGLVTMGAACNGGTAYGLGPQGDVQRAANYVRLVRDADAAQVSVSQTLYLSLVMANSSAANLPAYTIHQTLSDGAQRDTIAFDGLAFLTGSLGADSFFPPGKVADFWGFQYLRDNDPSQMGHNTDFLTRAALNMLYTLTPAQRSQLIALAESQVDEINQYAYNRFVLMDAFRRLLENDLPAGSSGLNKAALLDYSAQLYRLDGEISYARAQVMGGILNQLDSTQQDYLDVMVGKGMLTWPQVAEPAELQGLDRDVKVAVMTYAGDMFSWYAGSVEADVYFCPERQGTYFGSFYMKDAPAVGNPNYTISSNLTAEMGQAFLKALTPAQSTLIANLVDDQKPALYEIVDRREDVASLLRQFMSGGAPNQAAVLSRMERYGELDGEIIYRYATAFAQVQQTLSDAQQAELLKLRTDLLGGLSFPTGAYLYAQPIDMPSIPNSDFLLIP